MFRIHVHCETTNTWDLLQLALRTGCSSKISKSSNDSKHRRKRHFADIKPKALVWAIAEKDILGQITI